MAQRMLIDATQPEETRVVVHNGDRIEDFDYETATKKQLKGNIYLAKVTRVEPSLQAAFVEYGGNRHGFLPFSEIHPDYYRIPIADREALVAAEKAALRAEDDGEEEPTQEGAEGNGGNGADDAKTAPEAAAAGGPENGDVARLDLDDELDAPAVLQEVEVEAKVDSIGGDEVADAEDRRAQLLRRYKIQEVIKRRQILLIQVTKEERGNKGAALTTYLSLAGRYCVLMPNTNKGGGISRKISNASDRRRLKKVLAELNIPDGIAVIVRTAGSQRSKAEIRRDYEYLMRLWNEIRESTLKSTAPALIHEEANLIKRAIRDLYHRDMAEIQVEGEDGYKAAKAFMKSLMPSHARKVQLYKDDVPLFQRYKVERHLDAMHLPTVQLRSGGYIVLNATEALVAIDVNSGKATRERNIEETALKTNLEAAEEVGRQLRLRDLAGLVVIDFIDMEDARHNREVERKLKEALRSDRARIQLGRISPFGLLEMSRQRLRPSLFESSTALCPHCHGSGHVRTPESAALQILRSLEEEGLRQSGGKIVVAVPTDVALYLLNQKRAHLVQIEERYGLSVQVVADNTITTSEMKLERQGSRGGTVSRSTVVVGEEASEGGGRRRGRRRGRWSEEQAERPAPQAGEDAEESLAAPEGETPAEVGAGEHEDRPKKRRRRGKRGGRRRSRRGEEGVSEPQAAESAESAESTESDGAIEAAPDLTADEKAADPVEAPQAEEKAERPQRRRSGAGRERKPRKARAAETEPSESVERPAESAPEEAAQEKAAAAEKPKRRSSRSTVRRKPAAGKCAAEKAADAASPSTSDPAAPAPPANGEAAPASSGSESAPEAPASEAPAGEPPAVPRPSKRGESVAKPAEEAPAISQLNDGPEAQPKKKGWWNRLI